MSYVFATLVGALALALALGSSTADATPLGGAVQPQFEGVLVMYNPEDLVEAIDAMAGSLPVESSIYLAAESYDYLEPAAPNEAWEEDDESGLAFPVTNDLSLGLDYQLEEIEEITADLIEMGTVSIDHSSHKVMIRAQWQFGQSQ